MAKQSSTSASKAVLAALSKKESQRTAADWKVIHQQQLELTKAALADGASYLRLVHAANTDASELLTLVREYREQLAQALRLLADHPAAAELRRKEDDLRRRSSLIASKPRARTKNLRSADGSILRANYEAAKNAGRARGWKTRIAAEYGVSTKTLNKHVFSTPANTKEK